MGRTILFPVGPFDLPRKIRHKSLDYENIEETIVDACEECERLIGKDLEKACGLYVFALRVARGRNWPYYVGKAVKQSLPMRSLRNRDKKGLYADILQDTEYERAVPNITFFVALTEDGNLKKIGAKNLEISDAEKALIAAAKSVNDDLWNVQNTNDLSFEILGYTSCDGRSPAQKAVASMLHA